MAIDITKQRLQRLNGPQSRWLLAQKNRRKRIEPFQDLFSTRTGANGEKIFDVFDSVNGDIMLGYDLSSSTYNATNTVETQSNQLVAVASRNRVAAIPFGTCPNISTTLSSYNVQMEQDNDVNVNEACWVMLRGV